VQRLENELQRVKHIASVFRREDNKLAQNIGKAVYNMAVLYTLVKFKPQDYRVEFNGELFPATFLDAFSVNVSKIPTTGGGIKVCPDAKQDNGYFDVCIVSEIGKLKGISVLGKANKGKHLEEDGVAYWNETDKISKVAIEATSGNPFAIHFSGEPYVCQKLVLEIAPQKVKVIYNPNKV
jgi:diacylglycerol kinase (ATP)